MAAMQILPDVTVAAVAEISGRFLLVEERINGRRLFNQPAGHVEHGETLLAAVVREAREETAWHFNPQYLLGVYLWYNPASERKVLRFAFTGAVSDHDVSRPLDEGIIGTHWLTPEELERRHSQLRSPLVQRCVRDYLAGHRHDIHSVAGLDLPRAASIGTRAPSRRAAEVTAIQL
jgi:8-oxo-dGTP pyrophosphatase MutT (NUDIX family)